MSYKFENGVMNGTKPWEILFNVKCYELGGGEPCQHCYGHELKEHVRYDGTTWTEAIWYCPRVIAATSGDPYEGTQLCLDCVLEAAGDLE